MQTTEMLLYLLGLFATLFIIRQTIASVTIYDYQKGIFYRNGITDKIVGAGRYFYHKRKSQVSVIDMRETLLPLQGQEILTKDSLSVKVSATVSYQVVDPVAAIKNVKDYNASLYDRAQIALREAVSSSTLDELSQNRNAIDERICHDLGEAVQKIGIKISSAAIKDVMLPPQIKKAFTAILEARKESEKQLEKARGEQAVLRSLMNSSKLYETTPMLFQARLVQALSAGNNDIVFQSTSEGTLLAKR